MAKKQLTVEEMQVKIEKSNYSKAKFGKAFLSTIAVLLSLVITFSLVTIAFTNMGSSGVVVGVSNNGGNTSSDDFGDDSFDSSFDDSSDVTPDDGEDVTDDAGENTGDEPATDANNGGNAGENKPSGTTDSKQEYLDMYKTAVANARTKSKSVVRVKDGALNYKGIAEAGGLSSAASTLMGMFMAKNEAAIAVKNEAWDKSKLPNASALTLNGIQKITREDKGSTYVITVVAKNATNPKANADGVGSIAGVIEDSQITGAIGSVPGLKLSNINIAYENVTAVATVDKATGNLVELKLNAPCVLGLDAKLALISVPNAKVGIQVITEYKIAY